MIEVRDNEPEYSILKDPSSQTHNRYGLPIETVAEGDSLRDKSLNINGDAEISDNPNRYKQHGFFFNADNCIACHACETACSEKNDVPSHLAFRSVGFVEGGTYPAYQRINLSMACNHCDDPVCLKGCPTRAYTKFAEYGAVLQDPDICFGCGYCTWVCPYNAPQLDPVKGEVSKCNMCVDRLEVGLKPACVSACLGKALDFGVIENIPEDQSQAKTDIPGFPSAEITHPNIRFEQTKAVQREMTRNDSMPLKYHLSDSKDQFEVKLDKKDAADKQWNWRKLLLSHESSHMVFTLSTQAVMGAFLLLMLGQWLGQWSGSEQAHNAFALLFQTKLKLPLMAVMIAIVSLGLFKLNMHLGKPHRFYRGFYNLRHSPVSREIAGVSGFYTGLLAYGGYVLYQALWGDNNAPMSDLSLLENAVAIFTLIFGAMGLYYMYRLYRIAARPFWDHWQTASAFIGAALSLGALLIALVLVLSTDNYGAILPILSSTIALGLVIEAVGHLFHARDAKNKGDEGSASFYLQSTQYYYPWLIRNVLLAVNIGLAVYFIYHPALNALGLILALILLVSMLFAAIIGRSLFYTLVIPTTMPGAFFWKNQGFVEHARESGLANMPQLGVEHERHHAFNWDELLQTVKDSLKR